ncbi:unnamed protein product [Brassica oleracea]|uniref:(rape) hypothetical protein n=1 Tax=Brassica napus TaxID=3708 RepID=A0A816M5E9_BRANA|nr:unnamed protein product [Brassica napus]
MFSHDRIIWFSPLNTPPEPSTPCNYIWPLVQSQIENLWPSLEDGINLKQKNLCRKKSSLAAKSSSSEVTASRTKGRRPTFILDGTSEIIIPTKTRRWIIKRCVWHVYDCLMFVALWNPAGSLKISGISTVPTWVTLQNIPTSCYSRLGISHISSGLGEPMLTHKPRLDPFNIGETQILVPRESIKANDITSELPYQAADPNSGKEFGPHKTVLIPQHIPFQFGKPRASSTNINSTTTDSLSLQVAISHKESSTIFVQSSPDAKFTLLSTLAGSFSRFIICSHFSTSYGRCSIRIIMNENITLSGNDPINFVF